jgi:hypothetical protein
MLSSRLGAACVELGDHIPNPYFRPSMPDSTSATNVRLRLPGQFKKMTTEPAKT